MRISNVLRSITLASLALSATALIGCASQEPDDADDVEGVAEPLPANLTPGKEDGIGRRGLAVDGNYAETEAWKVKNRWEDRTTAEAKKAGMAWPVNSGLSWDEKFAAWMGSLEFVPSETSGYYQTIRITTPWGKVLPSGKLDCADGALLLRATFAAWYNLPFMISAGGNPTVYFGHFGARTSTGPWASAVKIANIYKDFSATPPANLANWPKDSRLRNMHLHGQTNGVYQDELPFYLAPGEGTGAYLDELHLNKRAARMMMYLLAYTGSENLADSANTYNLQPSALRTGDTLVYRRAPNGSGHTMLMLRVKDLGAGRKEAQNVFGNEPPAQLYVESPSTTKRNLTSNQGGGEGLSQDNRTPYVKLGGGIKRWRVAKAINGYWTNTWMDGDEANWVDSTDYPRLAKRPAQFETILGQASPTVLRDELISQIELKREHLRNNPSSCSARAGREQLFDQLISLSATNFGLNAEQVERKYRNVEDYIYAPLDYPKSRTCCWNSSSRSMHETIMKQVAAAQATGCTKPTVFKQTAGTFGAYQTYAAANMLPWGTWRADEECASSSLDDVEDTSLAPLVPYCALSTPPTP